MVATIVADAVSAGEQGGSRDSRPVEAADAPVPASSLRSQEDAPASEVSPASRTGQHGSTVKGTVWWGGEWNVPQPLSSGTDARDVESSVGSYENMAGTIRRRLPLDERGKTRARLGQGRDEPPAVPRGTNGEPGRRSEVLSKVVDRE